MLIKRYGHFKFWHSEMVENNVDHNKYSSQSACNGNFWLVTGMHPGLKSLPSLYLSVSLKTRECNTDDMNVYQMFYCFIKFTSCWHAFKNYVNHTDRRMMSSEGRANIQIVRLHYDIGNDECVWWILLNCICQSTYE